MTEREILRDFRTSLQEKNHDDICTILFLVEAMKGERDLQPVDLFCMSLPPYAFHYGMLSHFFVD